MPFRAPAAVVLASALCAYSVTSGSASPAGRDQQTNAYGAATKAFLDRVQEYVTFHNNVEKMVKPITETSNPAEIAKREAALGAMLIERRPNAKEGDFFIREMQPHIVRLIKEDFGKRSPADRKALIVELPKNVKIAVNTIYPHTLPLLTFPANLLKAFPELPKELEYRIVGRNLILRDVTGNVIVDIMRDVLPIPR